MSGRRFLDVLVALMERRVSAIFLACWCMALFAASFVVVTLLCARARP